MLIIYNIYYDKNNMNLICFFHMPQYKMTNIQILKIIKERSTI
jgi:hypothetical protein